MKENMAAINGWDGANKLLWLKGTPHGLNSISFSTSVSGCHDLTTTALKSEGPIQS